MYENVQRDVLIALANEYADFCKSEGININEVTECAASKWNFAKVYLDWWVVIALVLIPIIL